MNEFMKKIPALIYVCTFLSLTASGQVSTQTDSEGFIIINRGDTTIVGLAREDKAGACVVINSTHVPYFITGLSAWLGNVYNKRVRARGSFVIIDSRKLFEKYPLRQGYRIRYTLEDANWEVVK